MGCRRHGQPCLVRDQTNELVNVVVGIGAGETTIHPHFGIAASLSRRDGSPGTLQQPLHRGGRAFEDGRRLRLGKAQQVNKQEGAELSTR